MEVDSISKVLYYIFQYVIKTLHKNAFHDFIDELLLIKYDNNYVPVKQYKDKGCDGIIDNKIVISVYGPEKPDLDRFKAKIEEDYKKYENVWKEEYPIWCVIYNDDFTAERIRFINELNQNALKWGIKQLIGIISDFSYTQKKRLAIFLNLDDHLFNYNVLEEVIDNLIKSSQRASYGPQPPRSHVNEKIELNYKPEEVENARKEYELFLEKTSSALKDVLKAYSDEEIAALKFKVAKRFNELNGDFLTKLELLTNEFAGERENDDVYVYHVRMVLIYLFEICIIGARVVNEESLIQEE